MVCTWWSLIKRSRLQALVHSILTATCVLSLSESQAEAKFTQCGLHAGKTGLRAPDIGLHKHTWPFIPAPSALTLFENGAVFIQQKCFMSMFTLISNDFLLHVLTHSQAHWAADRSGSWEVSALPDGTMAILIKEGEEMFNIYLLFRCSALGSYPYTVWFVTRLKQDLDPSYLCEKD